MIDIKSRLMIENVDIYLYTSCNFILFSIFLICVSLIIWY